MLKRWRQKAEQSRSNTRETEQERRQPGTEGQWWGTRKLQRSPERVWGALVCCSSCSPGQSQWLAPLPGRQGGKGGSTWVLLPLD